MIELAGPVARLTGSAVLEVIGALQAGDRNETAPTVAATTPKTTLWPLIA